MGKIIRTITIDEENWLAAKRKTDNLSGSINELLENWIKVTKDRDMEDRVKANLKIEELKLELAAKEKKLQEIEKEKKKIKILKRL